MTDQNETVLYPREFIQRLPKSDIHVHLDGSLRLSTLIELAQKQGIELPAYTEEGLKETVFKSHYANLSEYLYGFHFCTAVLQDPQSLERAAYELAWDCIDEGVCYIEVRFAPQLHVNERQNIEEVLKAVNHGLVRAKYERNNSSQVMNNQFPAFEYGIIVCAMRHFEPGYSEYYRKLFQVHSYCPPKDLYPIASLELARASVDIRDRLEIPIVGFDLAGEEAGYPAAPHQESFMFVHRHFLKKTVHAGEAFGPESIFQAITDLNADRIGHGYYLFDAAAVRDPSIENRERYVRALAQYISDRRITIEVCLTSNMQTNPKITDLSNHQFRQMLKYKVSTAICTDNRTVSNTSMTNELFIASNSFGISRRELKNLVIYGFKRSFFRGNYLEKRAYVRGVIDHYEKVEADFFGQP
jgi:adenosine deaminase